MIILPDRDYTNDQLQAVLLHELTHLYRNDVFVKWLTLITCALHWFNPIIWLTRREIDRACELACDEAVINKLSGDSKLHYCDTLVRMAAGGVPRSALSTTMCEEKKMLKERLISIMKSKRHIRATAAATVLIASAAVIIAVLLGAGNANASGVKLERENIIPSLWVDFDSYEYDSFWSAQETLTLDEFPGVVFKWNAYPLTATDNSGEATTLIDGMPIWNVYLADLNGDKLPEFCATVSNGSGIVDTRVIVYDYANRQQHELENRMVYDYKLAIGDEGQLTVNQYAYNDDRIIASGYLYIQDGKLETSVEISGINRVTPAPIENAPPTGTPSPDAINASDAVATPSPDAPVITRGAVITRTQNPSDSPAESMPEVPRTAENTLFEGILEAVKTLYEYDTGLNGGIKYLAFNLTNIPQGERGGTEEFAGYLTRWTESLGLEPLFGTYEDMVEAGYIIPITPNTLSEAGFAEGLLFSIGEIKLEGNVLTLRVTKYRGPLGAAGADYTARFENGVWTVDEPENMLLA
jgi:hypothetical protein